MSLFRIACRIASIAGVVAFGGPLHAQTGRVVVAEENFRVGPQGNQLAVVLEGATLALGQARGSWREATLEGWVRAERVRAEARAGYDLTVESGGEALRSSPAGEPVARLLGGMRLTELERRDGWVRVRRGGWIWEPSLRVEPDRPAAGEESTRPAQPAAPVVVRTRGWVRSGQRGADLLDAIDGDRLARIDPLAPLEVTSREGNWVRVRVEGWVWAPSLEDEEGGEVLVDIPAAVLLANPENFRGRIVEWTVQFVTLERAERIRSDFHEGEPFILARGPGDEPGFVYIAVPPDRVARISRLAPLQQIRVLARVRTGRSHVMAAPVVDLLELLDDR